jgi:hypothetical protein
MAKQVAVKNETAMTTGSWRDRAATALAKTSTTLAKLPTGGSNFLSFKNGILSLGGQTLATPMPVVVLAEGFERSYYAKAYQADVKSSPDCYSYDNIGPHAEAKTPQSDVCRTCRMNAFGSSGKGKACKEGARVVMMHADALNNPESIGEAQLVQGRLSVLNSRVFGAYAKAVTGQGKALWQDVTSMDVKPDPKSQYAVTWRPEGVALDDETLDAISERVEEAEDMISAPYPDMDEAAANPLPGRRKF